MPWWGLQRRIGGARETGAGAGPIDRRVLATSSEFNSTRKTRKIAVFARTLRLLNERRGASVPLGRPSGTRHIYSSLIHKIEMISGESDDVITATRR